MADRVKNALTRKIGPLPAWGWFLLLGGAYYFYKKYSASSTGTGTGSVAPVTPVPGTGEQVLQPGESIYDPTAGTLATAPGGTNGSGGTDTSALTDAMNSLADAIAAGINVNGTNGGGSSNGAPTGNNTKAWNQWFNNRFNKRWRAKHKGQVKATAKTSKPPKVQSKTRARSTAKTRATTGGRTTTQHAKPETTTRARMVRSSPVRLAGTRQRALQPVVSHNVTQRRVATHPKPAAKEAPTVQHRPSAPAPRTVRAPAKPAPKRGRR